MEASLKIKLLNIQPCLGVREQELAASGEAEEHVAGGEGGVRHLHRILSEKYIPSLSPLLSSSIQYSFGWKTLSQYESRSPARVSWIFLASSWRHPRVILDHLWVVQTQKDLKPDNIKIYVFTASRMKKASRPGSRENTKASSATRVGWIHG